MSVNVACNGGCTAAPLSGFNRRPRLQGGNVYAVTRSERLEFMHDYNVNNSGILVQQKKASFSTVAHMMYEARHKAKCTFVYYTRCTEYKWTGRKAKTIAFSCVCFALPAITLLPVCSWEAWVWTAICAVSYLSDYTFSGRRDTVACAVHMSDRYLASTMVGIQILYNIPLWFRKGTAIGITGTFFALSSCCCKYIGGRTDSFRMHVFFHSLWHVLASVGRSVVAFMEYHALQKTWGIA